MDIDIKVATFGQGEAMAEFAKLHREIAKLYSEGLNTRQPITHLQTLSRGLHALGNELKNIAIPALGSLGINIGGMFDGGFSATPLGLAAAGIGAVGRRRCAVRDRRQDQAMVA
jgi:hypothetical protein